MGMKARHHFLVGQSVVLKDAQQHHDVHTFSEHTRSMPRRPIIIDKLGPHCWWAFQRTWKDGLPECTPVFEAETLGELQAIVRKHVPVRPRRKWKKGGR